MDEPQIDPPKLPTTGPSIHKVPRRFDLATMFVVTSAYAMFFGFMTAIDVPMEAQATIIGFLTFVGFVQMVVAERFARLAAVVCGWVTMSGITIAGLVLWERHVTLAQVFVSMFCSGFLWGTVLGYIGGVIVAGLFLVSHHVRNAVSRKQM